MKTSKINSHHYSTTTSKFQLLIFDLFSSMTPPSTNHLLGTSPPLVVLPYPFLAVDFTVPFTISISLLCSVLFSGRVDSMFCYIMFAFILCLIHGLLCYVSLGKKRFSQGNLCLHFTRENFKPPRVVRFEQDR